MLLNAGSGDSIREQTIIATSIPKAPKADAISPVCWKRKYEFANETQYPRSPTIKQMRFSGAVEKSSLKSKLSHKS